MLRIKVFPLRYFWWCGYSRRLWVSFVITGEFLVRVTEIISRIGVSWTHSLQLRFLPFFDSKVCKSDNFQSDSSVKLSFTSIRGVHSNFVRCESFLESNFLEFLLYFSMWDGPGWLNWFWQFLCERLSSLIRKDYFSDLYVLAVYVKEGLPLHGTHL